MDGSRGSGFVFEVSSSLAIDSACATEFGDGARRGDGERPSLGGVPDGVATFGVSEGVRRGLGSGKSIDSSSSAQRCSSIAGGRRAGALGCRFDFRVSISSTFTGVFKNAELHGVDVEGMASSDSDILRRRCAPFDQCSW